MPRRRADKVDANQKEIVDYLRQIKGMTVEVGHDDILVGYKGKTFWYEIKDPEKVLDKDGFLKESALKPSQVKLLNEWEGHYRIAWSAEQVLLDIMGIE